MILKLKLAWILQGCQSKTEDQTSYPAVCIFHPDILYADPVGCSRGQEQDRE